MKLRLRPSSRPCSSWWRVPFSQERWDYDAGELVRAVKGVLGEPAEAPKAAEAPQAEPPADSPRTVRPYQPSGRVQLPTTISRSLFQESPEERKARQAALEETFQREEERRERARAEAIPFFSRPDFWFAAFLTLVLGAAALVGGEALARVIANNWTSLPDPSIPAAILVVTLYALARIGLGAAA